MNKKTKKKIVPGPGYYNVVSLIKGPKYSFGKKQYPKKIKGQFKLEVPGVGSYNLRKEGSFICPCFKMDNEKRQNLTLNETALNYPAPNKYKKNYSITETTTPKWSFSKCSRTKAKSARSKLLSSTPGPGKYEIKTLMGTEGPHFSFCKEKYSHADAFDEAMAKIKKNYPCPGTYCQNIQYSPSGPFYSLSKLNRQEVSNDKFLIMCPGPDKYSPNKEFSSTFTKFPNWSISKTRKDENEKVIGSKKVHIITPGPGEYSNKIGKIPQGPKYTFAAKFKIKKIEENPGPGYYNAQKNHYPSEPKYSIGKEKKDNDMTKQALKDDYPGPGSYKIHDVNLCQEISFPKAKKEKEIKFFYPGPGQYKIPTSFDYINSMTREKGYFDPSFKFV